MPCCIDCFTAALDRAASAACSYNRILTFTVCLLPLSSRSQQVCLASSDLLHMYLALAGLRYYFYYCYYVLHRLFAHFPCLQDMWPPLTTDLQACHPLHISKAATCIYSLCILSHSTRAMTSYPHCICCTKSTYLLALMYVQLVLQTQNWWNTCSLACTEYATALQVLKKAAAAGVHDICTCFVPCTTLPACLTC